MTLVSTLGVGLVGCGRMGKRRAEEVASHRKSKLRMVADIDPTAASETAKKYRCDSVRDWETLIASPEIDAVIVAVPPSLTSEITIASLESGKHVLAEKPMGRDLAEAQKMALAGKKSKRILKIGFNHRYHPAIRKALELYREGLIGKIINIRARYGHGGRPGYEKEWRGNQDLVGGGELADQGVHVLDLIHAFAGLPQEAFGILQTAFWPIHPLEDNGFGLFRFSNGAVAILHTSWTQWKNLFSFEIFGEKGSLVIEGLGQSYGTERLQITIRKPEKGLPDIKEMVFEEPDDSWELEWQEFLAAIEKGTPYNGTPEDGLHAMRMLDALYRSAREKAIVRI